MKPILQRWRAAGAILAALGISVARGGAPSWFTYQGYLEVQGEPYGGEQGATGLFKFAIGDVAGQTNYWANDGTAYGEPDGAVGALVIKGLFAVNLGDTNIPGMAAMHAADFPADATCHVHLWFREDESNWIALTPPVALAQAPLQSYVDTRGDTMTGPLVLPGDPHAPLEAATKQYVDSLGTSVVFSAQLVSNQFFATLLASNDVFVTSLISNSVFVSGMTNQLDDIYVNVSGDTMTGPLMMLADVQVHGGDIILGTNDMVRFGGPGSATFIRYDGGQLQVYNNGARVLTCDGD